MPRAPTSPRSWRRRVRDVPDYPQPGVMFKDIAPLLADHEAFAAMVDALAEYGGDAAPGGRVDKVVGIEARGFIVAAPVAYTLGAGFVPVRKQGKLPGPTFATTYDLEYGTATLEVQQDAFSPGDRVLLVDDVLATGGTALAAAGAGATGRRHRGRPRRAARAAVPRRWRAGRGGRHRCPGPDHGLTGPITGEVGILHRLPPLCWVYREPFLARSCW